MKSLSESVTGLGMFCSHGGTPPSFLYSVNPLTVSRYFWLCYQGVRPRDLKGSGRCTRAKALDPMLVTLSGIMMEGRPVSADARRGTMVQRSDKANCFMIEKYKEDCSSRITVLSNLKITRNYSTVQ